MHQGMIPSRWIVAMLDAHGADAGHALDLACGSGRHSRLLWARGYTVCAIDRDPALADAFDDLSDNPRFAFEIHDLEAERWPLSGRHADVVVVSNYLYRPHLDLIGDLVAPDGLLIYETFGEGNARFGKPSNPDFLLAPDELQARFARTFEPLDAFFGEVCDPSLAVRARFCGRRRG